MNNTDKDGTTNVKYNSENNFKNKRKSANYSP
jgi:hypothetical protein